MMSKLLFASKVLLPWLLTPGLLSRHGAYWKKAGIYDAILLSKYSVNRDENLLAAALCFWNSASNTFDFCLGPMTPTHGRPADAVEYSAAAPVPEAAENKTAGILAVVTSRLKPPIMAMPIHSLPGSSTTTTFANPELGEFEAMDLDAQLDKLEKLKAKSKAVDRVKIWQSTDLDLDENQ
ncbi:hypothetical protein L3X38_041865 [Prunus dulcis]|uniref:Uncharacterized protein n=1 Tax=Prunus dulcis TaxID=3755 RepID=A0AAD4UVI2_PRUDU|nr:hypothetical protein L3X38_041865 [Prunus dulcis]